MKVTVKVEGLREVKAALRELPDATAKNVLRRVGRKRMKPVADRARDLAREDEGDLKASIRVGSKLSRRQRRAHRKVDRDDIEVHAGPGPLPQAITEEFGTEDQAPHPSMRPAWDAEKGGVLAGIKDDLWTEIRKSADRLARKAAKLKAGK